MGRSSAQPAEIAENWKNPVWKLLEGGCLVWQNTGVSSSVLKDYKNSFRIFYTSS